MTITLRELLHGVTAQPLAPVPVSGIACHSKQVRPGDLFVAIEGSTQDGHVFIEEAIARQASAIVAQRRPFDFAQGGVLSGVEGRRPASGHPCPCVVVPDTRQALAVMASRFYGHPSSKLRLVGVTGTNGKTTTTYLLQAILEASGARAGLLGTIMYHIGGRAIPSTNTTPGPLELQRYFAQMVGEGLAWCAMEVSSHALAQERVAGLEFEAAVFTNLGSDHLDYHKTREAYAAAKRHLFDFVRPNGCAVINVDDEYGRTLAETIPNRTVITYGMERPGDASVKHVVCSWQGTSFVLETRWGAVPVATPLLGRHNVWNITAAAATLLALGIPATAVREGLSAIERVPGRLERVPNESGLNVLIDYAHTADALRLALLSLRELSRGRLIVIFGCGGDRDHTKRPVMGRIASLIADHVVLTSDNPRMEEPLDIIHQIKAGFAPTFRQFQITPDREQAIASVLAEARADDTILIAGKGHEAYQIFDHVSIPFSDRDVVERYLSSRHSLALS